jgi:hypothetical protein
MFHNATHLGAASKKSVAPSLMLEATRSIDYASVSGIMAGYVPCSVPATDIGCNRSSAMA